MSWPQLPFDNVAVAQTDKGRRIKQRDYLPAGAIPVIDQGQEAIGGYTDDAAMTFDGELPVILFGDHTRAVKLVSQRFAVGADGIKIFRPANGVRPKYLYYWMKSAPIPDRGYGRHYQYLRRLVVPVPSPTAQDGIVAEIEKQFSRLDEAVAGLKRVKANLKRYKAAVLKSAVTGRLVPFESKWRSVKLGDVANVVDPHPSHRTPATFPEGAPYIGIGDFADDGNVARESARKVSPTVLDEHRLRYQLREGDFVFGKIGTIGRPVSLKAPFDYALSANIVLIQPDSSRIHPSFVLAYMASPLMSSLVSREARATTQAAFGIKRIRDLDIPLPPLPEQHRIVTEVDRVLSIAREVEAEVDANLKRAQGLRQAILYAAFKASEES